MPTTYVVQSTDMHEGLRSPADSSSSSLVVEQPMQISVTRQVVLYPIDATGAAGAGEVSVVF